MIVPRQRWRAGRIEHWCERSGVWYWRLSTHVHRYHRATCQCAAVCLPLIHAGKKKMPRRR